MRNYTMKHISNDKAIRICKRFLDDDVLTYSKLSNEFFENYSTIRKTIFEYIKDIDKDLYKKVKMKSKNLKATQLDQNKKDTRLFMKKFIDENLYNKNPVALTRCAEDMDMSWYKLKRYIYDFIKLEDKELFSEFETAIETMRKIKRPHAYINYPELIGNITKDFLENAKSIDYITEISIKYNRRPDYIRNCILYVSKRIDKDLNQKARELYLSFSKEKKRKSVLLKKAKRIPTVKAVCKLYLDTGCIFKTAKESGRTVSTVVKYIRRDIKEIDRDLYNRIQDFSADLTKNNKNKENLNG